LISNDDILISDFCKGGAKDRHRDLRCWKSESGTGVIGPRCHHRHRRILILTLHVSSAPFFISDELSLLLVVHFLISDPSHNSSFSFHSSFVPSSFIIIMGGGDTHCCYREQLAFSLYSKFREPRLYRAAGHMEHWDSIPARCQSHPKEAAFQHKFAPNDTALHRIFRVVQFECEPTRLDPAIEEQRLRAVEALLAANQQAAATLDAFLRTPLHLACMDLSSGSSTSSGTAAAAALILENDPRIACITDVEKRTPLHFLVARNDEIPMPFLQALIQHGSAAVHMADAVGETPIDIVIRRAKEIGHAEIILEMLQKVPLE
jgi:hypothetical protein